VNPHSTCKLTENQPGLQEQIRGHQRALLDGFAPPSTRAVVVLQSPFVEIGVAPDLANHYPPCYRVAGLRSAIGLAEARIVTKRVPLGERAILERTNTTHQLTERRREGQTRQGIETRAAGAMSSFNSSCSASGPFTRRRINGSWRRSCGRGASPAKDKRRGANNTRREPWPFAKRVRIIRALYRLDTNISAPLGQYVVLGMASPTARLRNTKSTPHRFNSSTSNT